MFRKIWPLWAFIFIWLFRVLTLPAVLQAAPPEGFQTTQVVGSGLSGPSGFDIAPDGRIFILQRTGEVKIYKNGQLLPDNFTVLPSANTGDRGLIGIAFDPDFLTNKYVYFYYTSSADLKNYLVRFSAETDTAGSDPLIIYHTPNQSFQLHVGGGVRFGPDGKIYLPIGDNGDAPQSQRLDNPHGKILRLNPDGSVPSDNPFVGQAGADPLIWAYGLRNPYRISFDSGSGRLYAGDVGANTWEEINLIEKGKNYGWPTCEGMCSPANPEFVDPIHAYPHNGESRAVTQGPIYRGPQFPNEYTGRLFFADYAGGFIKTLTLDEQGRSTGVSDFDTTVGTAVDLKAAPDGSLYYITYYPGRLYRISYSTGNHSPSASATASVQKGPAPLQVTFSSAGSFDPDGDTLSFSWNFGDGQTSGDPNPVHEYSADGVYLAELTVSDGVNSTPAVPLSIQVGISPTVTIGTPVNGLVYRAGDTIPYTVSAVDGVGNDINDNSISVEVIFHHGTHIHPFYGPVLGRAGSFTIPVSGESSSDVWYEVIATATDTSGLSETSTVSLVPQKTNVSFDTVPSGLTILIEGQPVVTPYVVESVVGYNWSVGVVSPQNVDGQEYTFSSWSDGLPASHIVVAEESNMSVVAQFSNPTVINNFTAQYFANMNLSGSPSITRSESAINFNWGENSPHTTIPADGFSARWNASKTFTSGLYRFTVTGDDGVRLFIDDELILDKWIDQSPTTYESQVFMASGTHVIRMEYYENSGDAVAKLSWEKLSDATPTPSPTLAPTPTSTPLPTPTSIPGEFNIEYFGNIILSGTPVLSTTSEAIDFDWGGGSPGPGVPTDNFSAKMSATKNFQPGVYTFYLTGDDGVRLYIDGQLIIDGWLDQPPTTYSVDADLSGNHSILVEYYERGGGAEVDLEWEQISSTLPTPTPPPAGSGMVGEYFANRNMFGLPVLTRSDDSINFDWGGGSPHSLVPNDNFSARWTTSLSTLSGESVRFLITADDGFRLKIDGVVVLDKWIDQPPTSYEVLQTPPAGDHTVSFEYYENGGGAVAKLDWEILGGTPSPTPIQTPTPTPAVGSGFSGYYFANKNLSGAPVLERIDPQLNFDWGGGSPGSPVPTDDFSVRWIKSQVFSAGDYVFTVVGDDGIRLFVDGVVVLDKWIDQSPTSYSVTVPLAAGTHLIALEYYESGGGAKVTLDWVQVVSTGFSAEYFSNKSLLGAPAVTRVDESINFDWGGGSPDPLIPTDDFSARWSTQVDLQSGNYSFTTTSDDGIRIFVDGVLILDKWIDQSPTTHQVTRALGQGTHTIVVEYYEAGGGATSRFSWAPI